MAMLEATIKSISITDIGFVIFLSCEGSEKVLPIFIGPVEAQSISMVLMDNKPKRPLTHDLMKSILEHTEFGVQKVEITEIKDETFFAKLYIHKSKGFRKNSKNGIIIDSRPSDAIAIALRTKSPIYVNEEIMLEHAILLKDEKNSTDTDEVSENGEDHPINKKVNDQLGKYRKMLDKAINEDRFEEAANIRDQIDQLMGIHDKASDN